MVFGLSVLTLASAVLTIRARCCEQRRLLYLFKPLAAFLILIVALRPSEAATPLYRYAIVVGLAFSLAGDVFLMLPGDRFVAGLGSFLLAHVAYIMAFSAGVPIASAPWLLVPLLAYLLAMTRVLWPHLGAMKAPVLVYEVVITVMAWRALARWLGPGGDAAGVTPMLAALGAVLFVVSDSALAVDRFVGHFRGVHWVVLGTYYAAQWLIAMSV